VKVPSSSIVVSAWAGSRILHEAAAVDVVLAKAGAGRRKFADLWWQELEGHRDLLRLQAGGTCCGEATSAAPCR
jgi:hypothetical protein